MPFPPIPFVQSQLDGLFPFYFLLNADLQIEHLSNELAVITQAQHGEALFDVFSIDKLPQPGSVRSVKDLLDRAVSGNVVLTPVADEEKRLEGSFVYWEKEGMALFAGQRYRDRDIIPNETLAMIARMTSNIVIVTDAAGRIGWVNSAFTKISGYSLEEAVGKKPGHILQGSETDLSTVQYLRGQIERSLPFHAEILNYTKSGQPYWIKTVGQPMFDAAGQLSGYFSIEENITVQKEAELVLRKASREIEEAAKEKESFLATMSHEIRTPISGIIGISNLMAKTDLSAEQKRLLQMISHSGNDLLYLVNDILDINKIQSGNFSFESIAFDLRDKIESAVQGFQFKADEKGIELFSCNEVPPGTIISGDPHRLGQVLNNLLSNAIKFTASGAVSISTRISPNGDQSVLTMQITDTGIGISEEQMPRIFSQYAQAGSEISRKYGGTGLGLSICKKLVDLQQGSINVNSTPGIGSTFTVTLPCRIVGNGSLTTPANPLNPTPEFGRKRILVAEDVPVNQYIARQILEGWGHSVVVVDNGKMAVEAVEKEIFDLVLMDLHMPEMNGIEATKRIRAKGDEKAHVPIIAVTAVAFKDEIRRLLNEGFSGHVIKPYSEKNLLNAIRSVFQTGEVNAPSHEEDDVTHAPGAPKKLYSLEAIAEYAHDSPAALQEMVAMFVESLEKDMSALNRSVSGKNAGEVADITHRLKTSLRIFRADSLLNPIMAMEILARNGSLDTSATRLLADIEHAYQDLVKEIKTDIMNIQAVV